MSFPLAGTGARTCPSGTSRPDESAPPSGSGSKPGGDFRSKPTDEKGKDEPRKEDTSSPKSDRPILTYKSLPKIGMSTPLEESVLLVLGEGGPWSLALIGLDEPEPDWSRLRLDKPSGENGGAL